MGMKIKMNILKIKMIARKGPQFSKNLLNAFETNFGNNEEDAVRKYLQDSSIPQAVKKYILRRLANSPRFDYIVKLVNNIDKLVRYGNQPSLTPLLWLEIMLQSHLRQMITSVALSSALSLLHVSLDKKIKSLESETTSIHNANDFVITARKINANIEKAVAVHDLCVLPLEMIKGIIKYLNGDENDILCFSLTCKRIFQIVASYLNGVISIKSDRLRQDTKCSFSTKQFYPKGPTKPFECSIENVTTEGNKREEASLFTIYYLFRCKEVTSSITKLILTKQEIDVEERIRRLSNE